MSKKVKGERITIKVKQGMSVWKWIRIILLVFAFLFVLGVVGRCSLPNLTLPNWLPDISDWLPDWIPSLGINSSSNGEGSKENGDNSTDSPSDGSSANDGTTETTDPDELATYKVSFYDGDSLYATHTTNKSGLLETFPNNPTPADGYAFIGWYTAADVEVTKNTTFLQDAECYAEYRALAKISFYLQTGDNDLWAIQTVAADGTLSVFPDDPTLDGFVFAGWYTAPDKQGEVITADTVFAQDSSVYGGWIEDNLPEGGETGGDGGEEGETGGNGGEEGETGGNSGEGSENPGGGTTSGGSTSGGSSEEGEQAKCDDYTDEIFSEYFNGVWGDTATEVPYYDGVICVDTDHYEAIFDDTQYRYFVIECVFNYNENYSFMMASVEAGCTWSTWIEEKGGSGSQIGINDAGAPVYVYTDGGEVYITIDQVNYHKIIGVSANDEIGYNAYRVEYIAVTSDELM